MVYSGVLWNSLCVLAELQNNSQRAMPNRDFPTSDEILPAKTMTRDFVAEDLHCSQSGNEVMISVRWEVFLLFWHNTLLSHRNVFIFTHRMH